MEAIRELLSIQSTLTVILGYRLSPVEFVGMLSAAASVFLAARMDALTWPAGLVSTIALGAVFYQVQLYSDMLLQLFFALVTLHGWRCWSTPTAIRGADIRPISSRRFVRSVLAIAIGSAALGFCSSRLHLWLPELFPLPAAFPFQDAFTTVTSIVATFLLARRLLDTWILWIAVDLVSVPLYLARSIPFLALLYAVFLCMAVHGFYMWMRLYKDAAGIRVR